MMKKDIEISEISLQFDSDILKKYFPGINKIVNRIKHHEYFITVTQYEEICRIVSKYKIDTTNIESNLCAIGIYFLHNNDRLKKLIYLESVDNERRKFYNTIVEFQKGDINLLGLNMRFVNNSGKENEVGFRFDFINKIWKESLLTICKQYGLDKSSKFEEVIDLEKIKNKLSLDKTPKLLMDYITAELINPASDAFKHRGEISNRKILSFIGKFMAIYGLIEPWNGSQPASEDNYFRDRVRKYFQ